MVLVKEKANRSMEQNREPQNRPPYIQSIDLWKSSKVNTMEQRKSLTNGAGTTGHTQEKIWI